MLIIVDINQCLSFVPVFEVVCNLPFRFLYCDTEFLYRLLAERSAYFALYYLHAGVGVSVVAWSRKATRSSKAKNTDL